MSGADSAAAPEALASHEAWQPHVNPYIIAVTVMLATFMEVLDTSVANVSLPHIAGNLSATIDESTWVLTSYLVSNAIILPLSGWLSSLFGRKRFYMTCVFLFSVSSLLCGLAPNLEMLVFFRIVQGVGGGALQPVSQAILIESFPRNKQGSAMALYGMGVVLAPIIGPTLGGWITDNFSWRWIFLINIPVGVLSLFLTSLLIKDPPYLVRRKLGKDFRIDYMGLGLICLGLGCLQYLMDKGEREDWFASRTMVVMAVLAGVGLIGAVLWEWRAEHPVVDLHLLKERNFSMAVLIMFMLGAILYSSLMLLPVFLQTLLGYNATLSGLVLSPGGVVVLLAMPLVGRLVSRYEARWLVLFGICVTAYSLFAMSRFNLQVDFRTVVWARMIQGLGLAFMFVPVNTVAFFFIPRPQMNNASGIINLARNVGGSVGIAFATTLLARHAQIHQAMLVSHVTLYDPAYQRAMGGTIQQLMYSGSSLPVATTQAQGLLYRQLVRQAMMLSFVDVFFILGVAFFLLVPVIFLMKRTRPRKGKVVAAH